MAHSASITNTDLISIPRPPMPWRCSTNSVRLTIVKRIRSLEEQSCALLKQGRLIAAGRRIDDANRLRGVV